MMGKLLQRDTAVLLHIVLDFSCKQGVTDVHRRMIDRIFYIGQITDEVTSYVPRQCILATSRLEVDSLKHLSRNPIDMMINA